MNQPRRGISWQTAFTLGVAIAAILYLVGRIHGG